MAAGRAFPPPSWSPATSSSSKRATRSRPTGALIESAALQAAEAALTGESVPVSKDTASIDGDAALGDRHNMVFSGTAATYGHGRAIVAATGMRTEMGRIAGLLKQTHDEPTPLQRELDRTGKRLGVAVLAIAVVMIAAILVVQDVRGAAAIFDVLILGVALAVAAVPEGLPAVVTVVLSIGVQRMARRHAIIRHLAAVETLGSATVIASDKTGTLTRNEMTVRVAVTASGRVAFDGTGYAPEGSVRREGGGDIDGPLRHRARSRASPSPTAPTTPSCTSATDGGRVHGDPTEGALLVAARQGRRRVGGARQRLPRVGELPFSSERKLMSTVHRDTEPRSRPGAHQGRARRPAGALLAGAGRRRHAPAHAGTSRRDPGGERGPRRRGAAHARRRGEAADAGRAGRAHGPAGRTPRAGSRLHRADRHHRSARPEAREAVAKARRAGIRPLMITGDHPRTASVIARELGIATDGRTLTGADLDALTRGRARRAPSPTVSVYARVNPEHKLRIVDALRRGGAIVAMTGDGVNDAPALKKADIGIAMGITGTDVSKEAADMVLADDDFATIVAAVEEGRAIFANIRKFLRYLLSSNIGEVLTMFAGVLFGAALGLDTGARRPACCRCWRRRSCGSTW